MEIGSRGAAEEDRRDGGLAEYSRVSRYLISISDSEILEKMKGLSHIVTSSPGILGGTPVFAGTRVPVQTLLDCLEAGDSIDLFLYDFPTVTREQVVAVLESAKQEMLEAVPA